MIYNIVYQIIEGNRRNNTRENKEGGKAIMSVISTANALLNDKFSFSFSKRRRIVGNFYLDKNYLPNGLIWSKFDLQIFHQAHFDEAAIVLFLIIS